MLVVVSPAKKLNMSLVQGLNVSEPYFKKNVDELVNVVRGLSLKELDQIEDPLYSGEREYWLYSLVGSQFTETEMASGNAYRYINGENVWLEK